MVEYDAARIIGANLCPFEFSSGSTGPVCALSTHCSPPAYTIPSDSERTLVVESREIWRRSWLILARWRGWKTRSSLPDWIITCTWRYFAGLGILGTQQLDFLPAHHATFLFFSSFLSPFVFISLSLRNLNFAPRNIGRCIEDSRSTFYFPIFFHFSFLRFKFPANRRGREKTLNGGGKRNLNFAPKSQKERMGRMDGEFCYYGRVPRAYYSMFTDILSGWKVTRRHYGNRSSWETISCTVNVASFSPLSWQCTMWPEYILLRWMRFLVCTYIRGPFE